MTRKRRTPTTTRRRVLETDRRLEALPASTLRELLGAAARPVFGADAWAWVRDYNEGDRWVVYDVAGPDGPASYRVGFTVTDTEPIGLELVGDPVKVIDTGGYAVAEARRVTATEGRVLEARGTADDGTRVWRSVVIEAGESANGRLYEARVLEAAVGLYDGVKVYNRHRTDAELATGTTEGLVGYLRRPSWSGTAIEADLHLFATAPGALAEALDASVGAQADGLPPILGLSHDAIASAVMVNAGGRSVEAVRSIDHVLSVDVVGDPAAGGRAVRVVAGGVTLPETSQPNTHPEQGDTVDRLRELMAAHLGGTITDEERSELAELLDTHLGIDLDTIAVADAPTTDDEAPATEPEPVAVGATETRRTFDAGTYEGAAIVTAALDGARLPAKLRESVAARVPARFTEADLRNLIEPARALAAELEASDILGRGPRVPGTKVVAEARDKAIERLDRTLEGGHRDAFRSFREMFAAFHPETSRDDLEGPDFAHVFLAESYRGFGRMGEFADRASGRVSEALTAASFAQVLGDSVTRRMVAEYAASPLNNYERIVSAVESVNDFRTQRVGRIGGYGTLSTVAEGNPYGALTSPGDEEATYAAAKRGGIETITLEMIANDDLRAFRAIPTRMGRAARQTLYRFVWGLITSNPTMTYDSVALFHASHGNLGAAALDATSLSAARVAMRKQAAYGDSAEVLGLSPAFLIVPPDLEDAAFELTRSAVAVTSGKDATVPNINAGTDMIVLPHLTDANNWYAIADPALAPTIELGFYKGQRDPELFVQDMGNVGSMFDADKVTLKVRHIYGGTVLDHRGMYAGIVA